jgi:hypothetical protein
MRTGNHTIRLVDLENPSRFTSNYVFVQAFPILVPEKTIKDGLPRLGLSDLEMYVSKIYPLKVAIQGR